MATEAQRNRLTPNATTVGASQWLAPTKQTVTGDLIGRPYTV